MHKVPSSVIFLLVSFQNHFAENLTYLQLVQVVNKPRGGANKPRSAVSKSEGGVNKSRGGVNKPGGELANLGVG